MVDLSAVLATIAFLAIIEGLILTIWPTKTKKALYYITKSKKHIKRIGIIELIIGILILLLLVLFMH